MKAKLLVAILFLYTSSIFAKEGMWLPFLLQQMNEKEMKSMGLKITANDIYSVNQGSLKDAVVIFGGGCTGEVISDKGLVLTNHHCGYGTVQGLSSVDHNYLTQGFFAPNQAGELPCPGLSVTFMIRFDDVTSKVNAGIEEGMPDTMRSRLQLKNIETIEKEAKAKTGYDAQVKSYFYDNTFYLILSEKYTDIRLVAFPPNGIGKFGGDTDNWAWPRHTGDFGLFRIYASPENKPAAFNIANKPFKPRKSFTLNIQGIKQNDFTMVYGFPGRTSEYLTHDGVNEVMNVLDPARIAIREKRLNIMEEAMRQDEKTFIQYASKQAGIANYYKKWKGEMLGLTLNNAVEKKKSDEALFRKWVNADVARKMKYGSVLDSIAACYARQEPIIKLNEYINEAIWSAELIKKGAMLSQIKSAADTVKSLDSLKRYATELNGFLNSINKETDQKIAMALYPMYSSAIASNELISTTFLEQLYANSFLSSTDKMNQLVSLKTKQEVNAAIDADPAYRTWHYYDSVQKVNLVKLKASTYRINSFYGRYLKALQEYKKGQQFYPDANSTMRVTYGKVEGVQPQDGVTYNFFTTLDGAVRKHNPDVEEFQLPSRLLELHAAKDYGRYAIQTSKGKTVPLAFLASNHTTGGNSGSPVLNAKGELIGTNFDRIWEGTMSDILFDPNLCRNITLDIRYTLFVIEKFGQAKWIVDEMKIVQ